MQWCWAKLWLLRAVVVCIPGRCPVSPHFMLMTRGAAFNLPPPRSHQNTIKMSPLWPVTVAGAMVRLVAGLATVWCQCGQSVDTEDRGPGARDPASGQCMARTPA